MNQNQSSFLNSKNNLSRHHEKQDFLDDKNSLHLSLIRKVFHSLCLSNLAFDTKSEKMEYSRNIYRNPEIGLDAPT